MAYDEEEVATLRKILRSYGTRLEAELMADQVRELGIPVTLMQDFPQLTYAGSNAPTELWLEDADILEDEEIRSQLELLLTPGPVPEAEFDRIEDQLEVNQEGDGQGTLAATLAVIIAVALLVVGSISMLIYKR